MQADDNKHRFQSCFEWRTVTKQCWTSRHQLTLGDFHPANGGACTEVKMFSFAIVFLFIDLVCSLNHFDLLAFLCNRGQWVAGWSSAI
jgi:hypothetical protein